MLSRNDIEKKLLKAITSLPTISLKRLSIEDISKHTKKTRLETVNVLQTIDDQSNQNVKSNTIETDILKLDPTKDGENEGKKSLFTSSLNNNENKEESSTFTKFTPNSNYTQKSKCFKIEADLWKLNSSKDNETCKNKSPIDSKLQFNNSKNKKKSSGKTSSIPNDCCIEEVGYIKKKEIDILELDLSKNSKTEKKKSMSCDDEIKERSSDFTIHTNNCNSADLIYSKLEADMMKLHSSKDNETSKNKIIEISKNSDEKKRKFSTHITTSIQTNDGVKKVKYNNKKEKNILKSDLSKNNGADKHKSLVISKLLDNEKNEKYSTKTCIPANCCIEKVSNNSKDEILKLDSLLNIDIETLKYKMCSKEIKRRASIKTFIKKKNNGIKGVIKKEETKFLKFDSSKNSETDPNKFKICAKQIKQKFSARTTSISDSNNIKKVKYNNKKETKNLKLDSSKNSKTDTNKSLDKFSANTTSVSGNSVKKGKYDNNKKMDNLKWGSSEHSETYINKSLNESSANKTSSPSNNDVEELRYKNIEEADSLKLHLSKYSETDTNKSPSKSFIQTGSNPDRSCVSLVKSKLHNSDKNKKYSDETSSIPTSCCIEEVVYQSKKKENIPKLDSSKNGEIKISQIDENNVRKKSSASIASTSTDSIIEDQKEKTDSLKLGSTKTSKYKVDTNKSLKKCEKYNKEIGTLIKPKPCNNEINEKSFKRIVNESEFKCKGEDICKVNTEISKSYNIRVRNVRELIMDTKLELFYKIFNIPKPNMYTKSVMSETNVQSYKTSNISLTKNKSNITLHEIETLFDKYFDKSIRDTIMIISFIIYATSINENAHINRPQNIKENSQVIKMYETYKKVLGSKLQSHVIAVVSLFTDSDFNNAMQIFFSCVITILRSLRHRYFPDHGHINIIRSLLNKRLNILDLLKTNRLIESKVFQSSLFNLIEFIEKTRNNHTSEIEGRLSLLFHPTITNCFQTVIDTVTDITTNKDLTILIDDAELKCRTLSKLKECVHSTSPVNTVKTNTNNNNNVQDQIQHLKTRHSVRPKNTENKPQNNSNTGLVKKHVNTSFDLNSKTFRTVQTLNNNMLIPNKSATPSVTVNSNSIDQGKITFKVGNKEYQMTSSTKQTITKSATSTVTVVQPKIENIQCFMQECTNNVMLECSNCLIAMYCSLSCQEKHWFMNHMFCCEKMKNNIK